MSERLSLRKDTFPSSVHGQEFLWLWCWFSVNGGWGSVDGGWGSVLESDFFTSYFTNGADVYVTAF